MTDDTIVTSKERISGQSNRSVRVAAGGRLEVQGQLNGAATVDRGGELHVRGQVNGDIEAHGSVIVYGQVTGSLLVHATATVLIAEGASIDGQRLAPGGRFAEGSSGAVFTTDGRAPLWRLAQDGTLSRE